NGECSDTWQVNPNENINGVIDLTKGVTKITDNHPTSRVEHGDEIDYKVTMSNDHIKANKYVKIETLLDKLPSNLKYVDNTFKIKFFETEYDAKNSSSNPDDNISGPGTRKELPLPSGADDYKLTLVDTDGDGKEDSIKVDWKKPIDLTAGSYTDNTFQKVKTFSYEFEYTLEADTTGIPENNRTLDQKNRVHVFTTNPVDELNRKNGVIVNDTQSNLDGKESTKSYIYQEANIKLINDSFNYGALTKSVTSNNNTFNIESNSEGRSYAINISNTGAKDYTISRFVDILPIYEKYKEGTMKINNASVDEASIKKGIYSNSDDIVKQQRLMHDEDLVVPANSKITITYDTVVDKESINTKMIETQNNEIKNLKNSFAFYMKDNATLLINDGGSKQADDGNKPDENWDDDKETKIRFQGDVGVGYIDNSIVPGIDINPYIVLDSGATQPYIQNVTPVNPGDNLAWRIKVGNASNASSNLIKGSKIVAVLPEGVVFDETNPDNQYVESTAAVTGNVDGTFVANKNKPSWLSDPTIKMSPTKQQIIVWTITDGDYGRSQGAGFTIRTKTQQYKFTSYAPEVYLVPIQESNQDFYENIMNSSGNNLLFNVWPGYQHMFGDLSSLIENGKNVHHVKDSTFVDVYGAYGLSAYKKVSDGKNTVTSRDANRLLKLDSRQDKFKYTLRLEAVKNDTRLSKLVFIDRLPSTGDIGVVTDGKRDSETPIRLDDNGNVKVSHKESATSATKTLDESQYRLEYFFGAANEKFSDNDKNGVVQSGRWYSEAEVVAANKEFSKATAIRVAIVDENIIIGALGEMEITFDAHLGEKVEDYNKSEAIGFNTFGYSLAYGAAMNDLKSEVVSVGVNAEVPDAQATIVKNVDLDGHTSAKSREYFESVDENRNFTFTLKGVDENNIEKDTKEFDINANVQNAKGYTGSVLIENLDPSLTYSISEKNNPNFVMSLESSKKIVGDQLQYTYTFTNKWQPLKIDLNKKWLDAKGNVIPTSNLNTLLKDYVKKDVDVDLYNSANVDVNLNTGETTAKDDSTTDNVDESTLPIESLRLGNAKVSLDTLNGSFGYYNQFDKNGSKLVYSLNERSGSINHSIFNITTSYKQEELIGTYTLNNKILGGDLELVKKDDLGNTLSGVEFELEDMLNQKTTHYTDESGKINLSTLNPGNYKFSEVEAPVGYEKLTSPIEFTIQPNAPTTLALEAINTIIRGDVELTKKDDLSNLLPGAQFELYTSDNQKIGETYTTNENGLIAVDNLLPNDYYFIEIKAPVGYDKAEGKISFTIPKNPSETIKVSAENKIIRGDVLLTKKDENDKVLKNAEFILVNENDQQIGSTYTTDVSGTIAVDKLLPGDYKFKETKAPDGYLMMPDVNDREYQFTIAHNPQNTVNVVAYNHQPLEFDLKAKKKVVGKKAPDSKFKFTLKGQNNAPMPQGSKGDSKEVNAGVGEIDFGKIKYTKVGEYKYTLVENKGNVKGFEYDKNKYTLNVNVGFNGRRMIYKVNYQQNGKDIQTKMVTFVNRYKGDISTTGTNEMFIAGISALLGITLYGTKLYYRKRNI
ncbi:MAG: SpaA isopeptide-forming pilin-related protein, partial [Erysipelotrichales bacterium]